MKAPESIRCKVCGCGTGKYHNHDNSCRYVQIGPLCDECDDELGHTNIVSCINACAGADNPKPGELAQLRKALEDVLHWSLAPVVREICRKALGEVDGE